MHDLIIVGAGTAGCVLAERSTRSSRANVLLVEAGGPPRHPFVKIPAAFARLFNSKLDWALESEPQTAAGRRIFIPRGKMLGGSANMNAQIHQWCHPADFDGWVRAGAAGWGWDDVEPIFRAQEHWTGGDGDSQRGRDGPMRIEPPRQAHRLSQAFVAAARAAGLDGQPHYNGQAYEGAWLCEVTQANGRRFSVYDSHLLPARRRTNLRVLTRARATRILVDRGRAVGVAVRQEGREQHINARAVVLAAGALMTPQLLMLSGIGPAEALTAMEIEVKVTAAEVGANLQDHPLVPLIFRARLPDTLKNATSAGNTLRYLLFRAGMLASNAVEAFAFGRVQAPPHAGPDLELIFAPFEWRQQGLEPPSIHAFTVASVAAAPHSRGRVRLASPDPLAAPLVDFGLLTDTRGVDAAVLLGGARIARTIAATTPLAEENSGEIFPGASIQSDNDLLAALIRRIQTVYHPVGTCRMGADSGAVVDCRLRVNGVNGLWVADASVMPTLPRGHPNAVVAMIAQRAAAFIEHDLT